MDATKKQSHNVLFVLMSMLNQTIFIINGLSNIPVVKSLSTLSIYWKFLDNKDNPLYNNSIAQVYQGQQYHFSKGQVVKKDNNYCRA